MAKSTNDVSDFFIETANPFVGPNTLNFEDLRLGKEKTECVWCNGIGVIRDGLHCGPCGGKGQSGGTL